MPHTLVHPVFIWPLRRFFPKWVDTSALIAGSIAPDLDIIFRFSETRHHLFSYSAANILFVILPIAVCISIYQRIVIQPILSSGELLSIRESFAQTFKKLPRTLVSALVAILFHLFLDNFTHFSDSNEMALNWAEDLGRDKGDHHDILKFLMYAPTLVISSLGALGGIFILIANRKEIASEAGFLWKNIFSFLGIFAIVFSSFSLMKFIKAGVEADFVVDSFAISLTCGLFSAYWLSAPILYLKGRIENMLTHLGNWTYRWKSLAPTLVFLYLLGLPRKEYLSIFMLKGVFIIFINVLGVYIWSQIDQKEDKAKAMSSLAFVLVCVAIFISPMSVGLKLLLLFQIFILISILFFGGIIKSRNWVILFIGNLSLNGAVAYYISNKGFGPAFLLILWIGCLMSCREIVSEMGAKIRKPMLKLTLLFLAELVLFSVIIFHQQPNIYPFFLLSLFIGLLIYFRSFKENTNGYFYSVYRIALPLVGVSFICFEYSFAYGILTAVCCWPLLFWTEVKPSEKVLIE